MTTQATPRLPLWRTVADAYVITVRNLGYLARISWLWVLVMAPIAFAYNVGTFAAGWATDTPSSSIWLLDSAISALLYMPMLASIAVAWHRRLLADEVLQGWFYLRLDRTVGTYLGLALAIYVIATSPFYIMVAWLTAHDPSGAWLLVVLFVSLVSIALALLISTRIWLVLPARALQRTDFGPRQAWSASSRNFWRLFIGCVLCTVPIWISVGVLVALGVDWAKAEQPLLYAASTTIIDGLVFTFLAGMPLVSFLSLAYRRLVISGDVGVAQPLP